ncbi:MAG: VCBS repeat-containing protein [Planctomycetota bacterium]
MRYILPAGAFFLASPAPLLAQFAAPAELTSTSDLTLGLVAEDVDGDGLVDLLATSSRDRAVSLFVGNGDGSFGARRVLASLDFAPQLVGQADLDADGDEDLLVAGIEGDIAFLERLDPGTLADPVPVGAALADPIDLLFEDMDGDGDVDAVLANAAGAFLIENLGGVLGAPRDLVPDEDEPISGLIIDDFDGDSDLDLVLSLLSGSASAGLYRNLGSDFGSREDIAFLGLPNDTRLDAGDVDGDGDTDLVQVIALPERILTVVNDGSGAFSVGELIPAPILFGRRIVDDLDGDGIVDIAVLPGFGGGGAIYGARGLGGGSFSPAAPISPAVPSFGSASALADLDGDGRLDAVGAGPIDPSTSRVLAVLNESTAAGLAFGGALDVTTAVPGVLGVRVADVDSDGFQDVFVLAEDGGASRWKRGDGLGGFVASRALPLDLNSVRDVRFADFDGDEVTDVVARGDRTALVVARGLGGGTFGSPLVLNPASPPPLQSVQEILVVDLDGDGDDDLVTGIDLSLRYYENLGGATWAAPRTLPGNARVTALAAGDLDLDGTVDLVLATSLAPAVIYDPIGPGQRFEEIDFSIVPGSPAATPVLADVDGDGRLDAVLRSLFPAPGVFWAQNAPLGFVPAQALTFIDNRSGRVAFVDVDGDGVEDVLQTDGNLRLRWARRDGSGYSTQPDILAEGVGDLAVGDIDGDGDADLFVTHPGSNAASWIEGTAFGPIGSAYCGPAVPNSTGASSRMEAYGTRRSAENRVTLVARDLPTQSFGLFLVSSAPDLVFPVPGSDGRLCLGAPIGRYVGSGQIQQSGAIGRFSLEIELAAIPGPNGSAATVPGDVWRFQAWHRDAGPAGATSNLTDALTIVFQ